MLTDTEDDQEYNIDNQLSQCSFHMEFTVVCGLLGVPCGPQSWKEDIIKLIWVAEK